MPNKIVHPGILLDNMLNERNLSQRDLASRIDVAHSLLNNILKGNRNINVHIAIALESAGFKDANFWLTEQMKFNLYQAQNDKDVIKKTKSIKEWNDIEEGGIVPLPFFKKQNIGINTSDDLNKIFEIYDVSDYSSLKKRVNEFNPTYFRKSSKFSENKNNVIAWSLMAKYKAKQENVPSFKRSNERLLLKELKKCFYENENVINETKKILNKYGIIFFTLNRPPQTPADGKSFISENNPTIVLSLKYKRLDNFAFTLFHELGHVFEHLTHPDRPELKNEEFFINSSNTEIVEFEANNYARNNLIEQNTWSDFITLNEEFNDDIILEFSKKHKIHPGIVRGRVCYEYNEYYRKRSTITEMNKLEEN
ncbi:HigA family addiction module antitoxin [Gelidibacter sp. F63206]|uniref:HigA family addiction module antitoxin n=1 Tax=Gelidibacter sp. F63206 TaxID=2926425 RepID=UPI001FF3244B|nr:HigA family addiction module antitoxin [Gelidibacter sp. F63206]MCK0115127.1 HigA family addiction module antitoxin [Gelidibacter sp. F63206]